VFFPTIIVIVDEKRTADIKNNTLVIEINTMYFFHFSKLNKNEKVLVINKFCKKFNKNSLFFQKKYSIIYVVR